MYHEGSATTFGEKMTMKNGEIRKTRGTLEKKQTTSKNGARTTTIRRGVILNLCYNAFL